MTFDRRSRTISAMHNVFSTILLAAIMAAPLAAAPLTDIERQRLLAHLDMTESWLASEIEGLAPEQLKFQMTPESWTITEVVEHLVLAEPQYWQRLQDSMKQPPAATKPEATDAGIMWYGIDRTNRARTGEARVPKGKWDNAREPFAEFRKLRSVMRTYAKTTQDDLRSRLLLEGNMDVYQWFLMISTHSQRHILQIREIKEHARYPRSSARSTAAIP